VKTLSDPQASAVKLDPTKIKRISIKTLRTKQKPAGASSEQRKPGGDNCLRARGLM